MSGSIVNNQDWETVVFKKRPSGPSDTQRKASACSGASVSKVTGCPAYKIERAADEGDKLPLVSVADRQAITRARVAKGMDRAHLARILNIPVKEVEQIENGKALENKRLLFKIKTALDIK